jgi:hypothetical protein
MKSTWNKVICAVVGVLVGLLGGIVLHMSQHTTASVATTVATSTIATTSKVVAATPGVIDAVYPLFASGISWSNKVSVSLPPRSNYNPTDQTIEGYQVTSLPTASTEDIGATVEPLRNYYDQLLIKNGWTINNNFEADGAGGSLWGFTKGSDILILSYTSTFMNNQPNTPSQCPCTIVFTIIGGSLK